MKKSEKLLSDLLRLTTNFRNEFHDCLTSVERNVVELFSNIVFAAYLDVPSEEVDDDEKE